MLVPYLFRVLKFQCGLLCTDTRVWVLVCVCVYIKRAVIKIQVLFIIINNNNISITAELIFYGINEVISINALKKRAAVKT